MQRVKQFRQVKPARINGLLSKLVVPGPAGQ